MPGVDILATAMTGANAAFLADLYARWVEKPDSVDPSFQELFAALNDDARAVLEDATGASWAPRPRGGFAPEEAAPAPAKGKGSAPAAAPGASRQEVLDSLRALMLIRVYRVRGHLEADLDPLGLQKKKTHAELDPASYGFTEADYDRPIFINGALGREIATLREILEILRASYCGAIGTEFMHIQDPDQKAWIQSRIEGAPWKAKDAFGKTEKAAILEDLTEAEGWEAFCAKKYVGTKRFGLEGGEATIAAVQAVIETGAKDGVNEVVIGMAHRGRLNTLVNVVRKPYVQLFSEFKGGSANPDSVQGSGDVKYHLGTSTDIEIEGRKVHLSLQPNPSHLECVDPVVAGKVRARQDMAGDTKGRKSVMGILLHGDAAFAGQGVVYETLAMSQLIGYRTGGTVHVVTNNQIGFTTTPAHAYSGLYCTDVAKSVQAPILHVNGDDAEAVVFAARLCTEFRQRFAVDVVLDIVCYRRHGHNETDEPAFTQPLMYARIKETPTARAKYAKQLINEGSLTEADVQGMLDAYNAKLEDAFQASASFRPNKADWLEGHWTGLKAPTDETADSEYETAVSLDTLREVGGALARVPADFNVNPKIARQLEAKKQAIETGEGIDWATGEALAFGTLLNEGHPIRLSGQDCERGTFSHRHSVLTDQETEARHIPLKHIREGQARFEVINSMLSEEAVLGFEYGYSLAEPEALTLWEAQFGDFANGAQVMFDQFISGGERKWLRMSGLVCLLPHGYEGQGPEHSSARLERYLQLCGEDNMQVANCTTPANYFHILRRQMKRDFRKPLILMTPKSLLRHKRCVSTLADFGSDSMFHRVLDDDAERRPDQVIKLAKDSKIRRVILCCGKVYYDLYEERERRGIDDVYLMRVEQLYPFPLEAVVQGIKRFRNADLVWCQEEPKNMGAWTFVEPYLEEALSALGSKQLRPVYAGRNASAATAAGTGALHQAQLKAFLEAAFAA